MKVYPIDALVDDNGFGAYSLIKWRIWNIVKVIKK